MSNYDPIPSTVRRMEQIREEIEETDDAEERKRLMHEYRLLRGALAQHITAPGKDEAR